MYKLYKNKLSILLNTKIIMYYVTYISQLHHAFAFLIKRRNKQKYDEKILLF